MSTLTVWMKVTQCAGEGTFTVTRLDVEFYGIHMFLKCGDCLPPILFEVQDFVRFPLTLRGRGVPERWLGILCPLHPPMAAPAETGRADNPGSVSTLVPMSDGKAGSGEGSCPVAGVSELGISQMRRGALRACPADIYLCKRKGILRNLK